MERRYVAARLAGGGSAIKLATVSGQRALLTLVAAPPAGWITIDGPNATVFLERTPFERLHHLLKTESPLTALRSSG